MTRAEARELYALCANATVDHRFKSLVFEALKEIGFDPAQKDIEQLRDVEQSSKPIGGGRKG